MFPDRYVHLGGDEVDFDCWKSSSRIVEYMRVNKIDSIANLLAQYTRRLVNMSLAANVTPIVWQEVYESGVPLPLETVVHVWVGNFPYLLTQITSAGLPAILSACWYLDSTNDWRKFYGCDPHDFYHNRRAVQKGLVIGGEACMWSELVDSTNVLQTIFPRTCATAEKLWSSRVGSSDFKSAQRRLEEHTCRMHIRGIAAQPPNGPGFCVGS